ncbi:MAG: YidC/Oxa1 family membrane protein insertase [Patescibacteria group bacterium]|nr:YidC/Oxa1 family membrane protein insertase [Patescibacteria group bacterium]
MSYIIYVYNLIFYQPTFNFLVWLYNVLPGHDIGLAIVLLTLAIRILLFPLFYQSIKSQKALQDIQPKIDEVRKKYKNDQQKQASEMMGLYKNEKVNPFSSCIPLLIQFPFLIAVYQSFGQGLSSKGLEMLYPFVHNPGVISAISLGYFNLAQPSIILAVLAGAAQFWQARMMITKRPPVIKGKDIPGSADENMMAAVNKQTLYFLPIFTVIIGISLPSGLTLYWLFTTILMALQQLWMFSHRKKAEAENLKANFPKI